MEKVEVSWQSFVDMFMSKHILNKSKSEWFQLKVVTCREMSRHFKFYHVIVLLKNNLSLN